MRQVKGARPLRPDDADAGRDRQRLDDLQGRLQHRRPTRRGSRDNVIHLSNLCTEILEVTIDGETAVCNLGSVNLAPLRRTAASSISTSWPHTVQLAVRFLDRVIDINYYPTPASRELQPTLAPGGPGHHGPAGRLLPAAPAVRLAEGPRSSRAGSRKRSTTRALRDVAANWPSSTARMTRSAETRAAKGELQFDLWGVDADRSERWEALAAAHDASPACATRC